MSTAAYLSGGIGINYYATSATLMSSSAGASAGAGASTPPTSALYNLQQSQYSYVPRLPLPGQAATSAMPSHAAAADPSLRRRLFAGIRPMSGFGRSRSRSSQHRSISLPESN